MKANILSIDAWRYDDNWVWNQWFVCREGIELPENITNRQLLRYMRDEGYLSSQSAGRVAIDGDGYNLVVMDKNTREPLFAVEYGPYLD